MKDYDTYLNDVSSQTDLVVLVVQYGFCLLHFL